MKYNILRIYFSNHFSFKEGEEIFFTNDNKFSSDDSIWNLIDTDNEEKVLPVTAFYGANASGKTNILEAFAKLSDFLGRRSSAEEDIEAYKPFLLDSDYKNKESSLELEFILDNHRYLLEISFNEKAIINEKLSVMKSRYSVIYDKKENKFSSKFFSAEAKKDIEDLKRNDVLILEIMSLRGEKLFKDVYNFIKEISSNRIKENPLERIYDNAEVKKEFLKYINHADIGIDDIKIEKKERKIETIIEKIKLFKAIRDDSLSPEDINSIAKKSLENNKYEYDLTFLHKGKDGKLFPIEAESGGTLKLFEYLSIFLPSFMLGGIHIIDEIESKLHPNLVIEIIKLFHRKDINKAGAQLIFTSHNTNLLKSNILRRDEVWFVEKNKEGCSSSYPLSSFKNVRNNYDYDKGYLSGKFGAIPFLGDINNLISLCGEECSEKK